MHGHSHKTEEHYLELGIIKAIKDNGYVPQSYNVGCMLWNYEPVTLDEILSCKTELDVLDELSKTEENVDENGDEQADE